jgi:hypothetical protein
MPVAHSGQPVDASGVVRGTPHDSPAPERSQQQGTLPPEPDGTTMTADLFPFLCEVLGYPPDRVFSIRVSRRQVVVAAASSSGTLQVGRYLQSDGRPSPERGTPGHAGGVRC